MAKAKFGRLVGATALTAGTCVGGGILALPVETGAVGFWPSIVALFISWAFMTSTGLLFAEASLWMKEEGAHIVTIAKHLLGRWGEVVSILLYIFIGYASLVAYNAGASILIVNFFENVFGVSLVRWEGCFIFAVVFGAIFYAGSRILGWINTWFVVGMIITYFSMIGLGINEVKMSLIARESWHGAYLIFPLLLSTFSFQMIVPSLALYLERDGRALRKSIIIGTTFPFIAYILWLWIVLGTVPNEGPNGLANSFKMGYAATESLKHFVNNPFLATFAEYFAFFALVTSYLGIGLGLYDFLSDMTKIQKRGWGKCILGLLVILPTLYFTLLYPNAFVHALDITGGFGDSILNGVIPVLMIWVGRYVIGYESEHPFWGRRGSLVILFGFSVFVFAVQIVKFFV